MNKNKGDILQVRGIIDDHTFGARAIKELCHTRLTALAEPSCGTVCIRHWWSSEAIIRFEEDRPKGKDEVAVAPEFPPLDKRAAIRFPARRRRRARLRLNPGLG